MYPILFRIPYFDLPIYSYGLMMVIGFLAAIQLAKYLAKRSGEVSQALLSVTDARAAASDRPTIIKAYRSVRGMAVKQVEAGGRCLEHRRIVRMDDRLHGIDGAMRSKARQARPDHRFAGDRTILLRHIAASPEPASGRNHDRYHPRCHESVQYCAARARL